MGDQNKVISLNNEAILMNKLSEPEKIDQLISLIDKLDKFNAMFEMMEHFIVRGPEMADSVNRLVIALREQFPNDNLMDNLQKSLETLQRLQKFLNSEEFKELEAILLNEKTLNLVGSFTRSIKEASSNTEYENKQNAGIFGLLKEITNPEIQPAIQFILNLAKILSKELQNA